MTQNRDALWTSSSDQAQALPKRWLHKLLHNQLTHSPGGFSRKALTYRPAKTLLAYGMSSALIASTLVLGIQQPALAAACSTPGGTGDTFSGGDGQTAATAWQINTPTDLIRLSELHETTASFRDDYYVQKDDIDLGGTCEWKPIGHDFSVKFGGTYDGGGFEISGLFINSPTSQNVGLFGLVNSGTVKNLKLTDVNIIGGGQVGTVAGYIQGTGTIQNVSSSGTVNGAFATGGLIGQLGGGTVANSHSSVTVSAQDWPDKPSIVVEDAGGLVGLQESATISNSYPTGTVRDISVQRATANTVGGLTGSGAQTVNDSFWDTDSSGQSTSARGTGKSTAEMKTLSTFNDTATVGLDTAWGIVDGWEPFNFESPSNYWGICSRENFGYPFLLAHHTSDPCAEPGSQEQGSPGETQSAVATTTAPTPATTAPQRIAPRVALTPPPAVTGPVFSSGTIPAPPQAATALIRGIPATLQQSVPDTTTLSLVTGSVALDMTVTSGSGARSSDGVTQLGVTNGSSVELAGSGLFPGSSVQVFIPLSAEDSRELARLVVKPDGTFSGAAAFSTDPLAAPLPIGPRLLQLVTIDEDGNQVVLEMTVTIEQSDPNPEFNRELGNIPTMILGSLEATSAGLPIDATITALADQRLAVVEGDGWTMAINIDSPDGAVEQTEAGALLKLVRDETALVSGSGFMAGTRADVWLFSEPTLVGTVTIDENGDFTGEVTIDPDLIPSGEHTLQLQGVGTDGYVKAANLGVSVEDAGVTASVVPENGFSWNFLWWVLLVAVVGLIVWFMIRRRMAASRV